MTMQTDKRPDRTRDTGSGCCEVEGRGRTTHARGLCFRHYMRLWKAGRLPVLPPVTDPEVLQRRARYRAKYARRRALRAAGILSFQSQIDGDGITALIRGDYLTENDAPDATKIGAAVARLLKDLGA